MKILHFTVYYILFDDVLALGNNLKRSLYDSQQIYPRRNKSRKFGLLSSENASSTPSLSVVRRFFLGMKRF